MPFLTVGRAEEQQGPEVVVIRKEKVEAADAAAEEAKAEAQSESASETEEKTEA
jgi:hypothetical protein